MSEIVGGATVGGGVERSAEFEGYVDVALKLNEGQWFRKAVWGIGGLDGHEAEDRRQGERY